MFFLGFTVFLALVCAAHPALAQLQPLSNRFTFPVPPMKKPCEGCEPIAPAKFAFHLIAPADRAKYMEIVRSSNPRTIHNGGAAEWWEKEVSRTKKLIGIARKAIFFGFERRAPLTPAFREGLERRLKRVEDGEAALLLITDEHDPNKVYLTVSVGFDFGDGVPSELDLMAAGQPPLPVIEPQEGSAPIRLLRMMGTPTDIEELEAWVARQLYIYGGRTELGLFVTPNTSQYDFVPFIQRMLIANKLTLYTKIPLGNRRAPAVHPCDGCERIVNRNRVLGLYLPLELRDPTQQRYSMVTEIVVWAVGSQLERLYVRQFNFGNPVETIVLPGYADPIHRFVIPRTKWEGEILNLLDERRGGELARSANVSWSIFDKNFETQLDCGHAMTQQRANTSED